MEWFIDNRHFTDPMNIENLALRRNVGLLLECNRTAIPNHHSTPPPPKKTDTFKLTLVEQS